MQACAEKVGQVQVDCGLLQPVGDYVESFNFGLVEVRGGSRIFIAQSVLIHYKSLIAGSGTVTVC